MNGNGMMTMKKRLIPWTTKIAEVKNSCGIYISNDSIKKFLENAGYSEYLDISKYESDLSKNSKSIISSYGFFTKQKLPDDLNEVIEHPMIFFIELHQFKKIGSINYTTAILCFKESSQDHQNFDTSNPIYIDMFPDKIGDAKIYAEKLYLGSGWTTNGRFEKLNQAIESLDNDILEREKIQKSK